MKNITAFAGSNSQSSINKQLATYASGMLNGQTVEVLDLNDYELPLYSIDLENEEGIPENAKAFLEKLHASDGIILSLAEHNGAYSTAFKNIFDWMSRIDGKLWKEIPMLLMATSPGGRGGSSVLEIAKNRFPYMGGNIVSSFSLPNFYDNFKGGSISDESLNDQLINAVTTLKENL
ncbi:MAG: NAD(P)H-dependent oxidoreductase [Flavobacteriaceae bacterium]|nr:NAD(P)H-dependent oxidoreductase [Flavobacteriaceae bacterium]